jgi:LPS sulfotransferase NodH
MDPMRPLFVIGNPRSGTTLLRLLLHNHRELVVPPECGFALWWQEKYGEWSAGDAQDRSKREAFLADLARSRKIETWKLDVSILGEAIVQEQPASYPELVALVYSAYAQTIGKHAKRWGDKNNFHIMHIARLHRLFPRAQFVHIVRDGRDVACSYRAVMSRRSISQYAPRLPVDIREIAQEWTSNLSHAAKDLVSLPSHQVHELRYEDLVTEPSASLRDLCAFLGIAYDPQMLLFHLRNRLERQEPPAFLQWKANTTREISTAQAGKFRKLLAPDEIREFESIAAPILERYGYTIGHPTYTTSC